MPRRAVFRCDGGAKIGAGHVARCLTLADRLADEGWSCIFLVNSEAASVLPRLMQSRHAVQALGEDLRHSAEPVNALGGDLLVVDNYQLGAGFEAAAGESFSLVMAIEDHPERAHSCDILLNQNAGSDGGADSPAGEAAYGKVSHYLMGPQYALLAPQYAELRAPTLARRMNTREARRLLISFGASDPHDYCGRAASGILESGCDLAIDIVVSKASPNAAALRDLERRAGGRVRLHSDTPKMAELMAEADLSIGAAGATTWERCCLGLPTVVYRIADNQAQIAAEIAAQDAGMVMGEGELMDLVELRQAVLGLCADPERRARMTENAARMTDGQGAGRVVEAVAALLPGGKTGTRGRSGGAHD